MKQSGLLLGLVLLCGCANLPSLQKVEHSFLREHPDSKIIGVSGQITNRFCAEFHIYYTEAGDRQEHEDVWHYHHAVEAWVEGPKESVR